jgi:hypothetical protein
LIVGGKIFGAAVVVSWWRIVYDYVKVDCEWWMWMRIKTSGVGLLYRKVLAASD